MSAIGQAASNAGKSLLNDVIGSTSSAFIIIHDQRQNGGQRRFPVQFNPSEIQLYASCTPDSKSDTAPKDKNKSVAVVDTPTHPVFEMTVTLLFDAVFAADSFMMEKYANTLTSPVSAENIKTVVALAQNKVYTVQPQVEGLLAALRDPLTRSAAFYWGDFIFEGNIRQIMAKYTMFSVSGRPVRAEVTLRLRQDNAAQLVSWKEDFKRAFALKGSDTSLVRPGQKGGNLINFNF